MKNDIEIEERNLLLADNSAENKIWLKNIKFKKFNILGQDCARTRAIAWGVVEKKKRDRERNHC